MSDFIISSPDAPTLQAAAVTLGFWNATTGSFITQGHIPSDPDPLSSFFLNIVGTVYEPTGATTTDSFNNVVPVMAAIPGVWARLRINGSNVFQTGVLQIPTTLTIYNLVTPTDGSAPFWSSDGVTPAPSYVGYIGVIA